MHVRAVVGGGGLGRGPGTLSVSTRQGVMCRSPRGAQRLRHTVQSVGVGLTEDPGLEPSTGGGACKHLPLPGPQGGHEHVSQHGVKQPPLGRKGPEERGTREGGRPCGAVGRVSDP